MIFSDNLGKVIYFIDIFKVSFSLGDETTPLPRCQNFECPNNEVEGGLYPDGDGCSGTFCECSRGL